MSKKSLGNCALAFGAVIGMNCGQASGEQDSETQPLLASLKASADTTRELGVARWNIARNQHAIGLDRHGETLIDLEVHIADARSNWEFRVSESDEKAVLRLDGRLDKADSEWAAASALALYRDAQAPLNLAASSAALDVDERVGRLSEALAVYDEAPVKYNAGSDCLAQTHVDFAGSGVDARTTVRSPYLFSGCWVRTDLTLHLTAGYAETQSFQSMACGVWDPGCPEERTTQAVFNASAPIDDVRISYFSTGNGTSRF